MPISTEPMAPVALDAPPSRGTNPFATCWTSPGKLPYVETTGCALADIEQRLEQANGWGAIVGLHGSGKSALLRKLQSEWAAGRFLTRYQQVETVQLDTAPQLKQPLSTLLRGEGGKTLCLLEGFERLGLVARRRVLWQCQRQAVDVVVTLHPQSPHSLTPRFLAFQPMNSWPWRLPTLVNLRPSWEDIRQLFDQLVSRERCPLVTWTDALQAIDRLEGNRLNGKQGDFPDVNLRELWFSLYLLHEKRRRARTESACFA